ncbi:hypothetical protein Hanom_Chr08g00744411 [Helianthus anomalus]
MPQNHLPLPALQFILQTNTLQRDCILNLIKANSTGDSIGWRDKHICIYIRLYFVSLMIYYLSVSANLNVDGGCLPTNIPVSDKSTLDAANSNREKELLNEITYLQWRYVCAHAYLFWFDLIDDKIFSFPINVGSHVHKRSSRNVEPKIFRLFCNPAMPIFEFHKEVEKRER